MPVGKLLSSITTSFQFSFLYFQFSVDIHEKYPLNYEFNTSCLVERQVFLARFVPVWSTTTQDCRPFT